MSTDLERSVHSVCMSRIEAGLNANKLQLRQLHDEDFSDVHQDLSKCVVPSHVLAISRKFTHGKVPGPGLLPVDVIKAGGIEMSKISTPLLIKASWNIKEPLSWAVHWYRFSKAKACAHVLLAHDQCDDHILQFAMHTNGGSDVGKAGVFQQFDLVAEAARLHVMCQFFFHFCSGYRAEGDLQHSIEGQAIVDGKHLFCISNDLRLAKQHPDLTDQKTKNFLRMKEAPDRRWRRTQLWNLVCCPAQAAGPRASEILRSPMRALWPRTQEMEAGGSRNWSLSFPWAAYVPTAQVVHLQRSYNDLWSAWSMQSSGRTQGRRFTLRPWRRRWRLQSQGFWPIVRSTAAAIGCQLSCRSTDISDDHSQAWTHAAAPRWSERFTIWSLRTGLVTWTSSTCSFQLVRRLDSCTDGFRFGMHLDEILGRYANSDVWWES